MACSTCSHGQQVLLVDPDWLLLKKPEFPSAPTDEFVDEVPPQSHPAVTAEFVDGVPPQSHVLKYPAAVAENCRRLAAAPEFVVDEMGERVGAL